MSRTLLPVAVAACLLLIPALAYSAGGGTITAVDGPPRAWLANTGGTTLTIAAGDSVTFSYPAGTIVHNLRFPGGAPAACNAIAPQPAGPGWSGSCTFDTPGTYAFVCDVHRAMTGTIVVEGAEAPTPAPTASPAPAPSVSPAPSASPVALPAPAAAQGTLRFRASQAGTRVRGSVATPARARLEVTVSASLRGTRTRIGHAVVPATAAGDVAFSLRLSAAARAALRRHSRLTATVTVVLSPAGGRTLTGTAALRLRGRG